jgi:diguanylate cyclase
MQTTGYGFDARWVAAWELRRRDPNGALGEALALRLQAEGGAPGEAERRGRLLLLEGSCRWRLSAYGEALRCLTQALELLPETSLEHRAATLQDLGTIHVYLGQHDEALARLLAALELREAIDDEQGRSDVENNLGIVFYHRGDLHEAERSYRDSLRRRQKLGDQDGVAACRNNLAKVLTDQGRYDDGLRELERAHDLWTTLRNRRGLAMALTNIGIVHQARDELEVAAACYLDSLAIKREIGDRSGECETATYLGTVRARQQRFDEALELLHHAASDAERLGLHSELAEACLALSEVHEGFGDHAGALVWFRRYHAAERTRFDDRSAERLHALQVSFQLARAEQEGALDGLTGLSNRRTLDRELHEAFSAARRDGTDLALALLDLDDFKHINDTFGHQVGDEVLRRTATVLREHTRREDLTARYGGEEFAVAFPGATLDGAIRAAEQLCSRIRDLPWAEVHGELTITVSIGVAAAADVSDVTELLARADHHLYRAKHRGKDRVHG